MSGIKPELHLWLTNMIQVCLKKRDGEIGTTSRYNCIVIGMWQRKSTGQKEMKNEDTNPFHEGWSDIKLIGDWVCGHCLVNTNYCYWIMITNHSFVCLYKSRLDIRSNCLLFLEGCYWCPQRWVSLTISTCDNRYRESMVLAACLGDRTVCSWCCGLFVQRKPQDRFAMTWSLAFSKQVNHSWQPALDMYGELQPLFERRWPAWLELRWHPQLMRV